MKHKEAWIAVGVDERQVAFLAFLLTAAIASASALLAWSKVILWSLLVTL